MPNEEPAIAALENDDGTTVYVSWNGDTETKVWRFYALGTGRFAVKKFLGEKKRTGFETSLKVEGKRVGRVVAEAVDAKGRVLRVTGAAVLEPEVLRAGVGKGKKVGGKGWEQSVMEL